MTSDSKLAKNTILYSVGTLLPQIAAFFLLPIYLKFLSPSDYGILNSVQIIGSVLTIIYTLSIDKAIYRLYFDFKTEKLKKDYLGTIFITVSFSVFFITLFLFFFPQILGSIYKSITFYPYISLAVIASSLSTFIIIPRTIYFVQEKAAKVVLISLSEFFVRNIFIFIFVVFLSKGVEGYLFGQILGSSILTPFFLYITSKQINFKFVMPYAISSLKYSIPMLPNLISAWSMSTIDRLFIERFFNLEDVGIYSLGYKIAMLVTIISGAFYKAYNPYYFKMATNGLKDKVLPQLKKTNTVYLVSVIVAGSMVAFFSKEIVYMFFDPIYLKTYKVIIIISLAFAITQFNGIFNLAIYQEKKTMFLMYINVFACFVNIGLNYVLISRYGVFGAAWATVFTYVFVNLLSYYYAKKCYYASFNLNTVSITFILCVLLNVVFFYLDFKIFTALILKTAIILIILFVLWFNFKSVILKVLKIK